MVTSILVGKYRRFTETLCPSSGLALFFPKRLYLPASPRGVMPPAEEHLEALEDRRCGIVSVALLQFVCYINKLTFYCAIKPFFAP
jgi:hypothetical protein